MKSKQQKIRKESKLKSFLKILGPGLVTGASDDDPSGVATYSQAGAQFGLGTLWTALLTFPLMAAMQEMCARIGVVTGSGLTGTLKEHYPKTILYLMLLFSVPAVVLNIGADIEGMGAVAHLIIPAMPIFGWCLIFAGLLLFAIIRFPYQKIAMILKWLCLVLCLYIVIPFMVKVQWSAVLHATFVPQLKFNKDFISILVAILGTTISPYLFFWQATMSSEDIAQKKATVIVNKRFLTEVKEDVYFGMGASNLVMFFIILTSGVVLFNGGIHKIDTVDQAAKALEPLAGKFAYVIFALGIIGTGCLAIPVLTGSISYMVGETFGWKVGLEKKFGSAKAFYATIIISLIIGLSLDFAGISPIKALLYTAILYGLSSPVLIVMVLHISNNKAVMGKNVNGRWSNIAGWLTFALMTVAAVLLVYFLFH
ncbi:NRAMP (natural resistance-associated macrophage protein) metal ion transporters [Mucilaginibacter pineti]|uniref:NRAMP (Natural resistance-associated macrophage protein) metal ion transporters n=1 Tax=Mucilaginibacter pineti TaxID=1391627 RepID=A0A1G7JVD4_9SPHI|nr:divalent metal cation transporter [Mucilaginibacter pineti]SDF28888.1 NRAMP (natural resistance-associated macrophage protein) metal ion transporters [Mucilaginibacter pineti]